MTVPKYPLEEVIFLNVCLTLTLTAHAVGNIGAQYYFGCGRLAEFPILCVADSHIRGELSSLKIACYGASVELTLAKGNEKVAAQSPVESPGVSSDPVVGAVETPPPCDFD